MPNILCLMLKFFSFECVHLEIIDLSENKCDSFIS